MIGSVITRETKKEDWPHIRKKIKERILETFGTSPVALAPQKNKYEVLERYEAHGLPHIKIKYHVFADEWAYGVLILPKELEEQQTAPAVLTIHGTNGNVGKYGVCDPDYVKKNRAYATELAHRGFITFSPDQYGFGEAMNDEQYRNNFERFYERYPDWSLSSRRVLGHIRALDVLDQLPFVMHDGYGAIGNSLGGQAALYIAAFDDRIKVSVPSTGISPNITNVYRDLTRTQHLEPGVTNYIKENGKMPWDLQEILALCAPSAVLCLEPFNDPYNPYTSATIDCIRRAFEVYELLNIPHRLSMFVHGDGHDTVDYARELAYNWLARFLKHG